MTTTSPPSRQGRVVVTVFVLGMVAAFAAAALAVASVRAERDRMLIAPDAGARGDR